MDGACRAVALALDHDRLFKELLTAFFVEFLELFLPNLLAIVDRDSLECVSQEFFTRRRGVETKRVVDLLVSARFNSQAKRPGMRLMIHVEHQSTVPPEATRRYYDYHKALVDDLDLPVYPIVLYSHDRPWKEQPDVYRVDFPPEEDGRPILWFKARVVQLNRYSWRDFARTTNPIAAALMSRMRVSPRDRVRVKLTCLRSLLGMKLKPKRMQVAGRFVDSYLQLNKLEEEQFQREVAKMEPRERTQIAEYVTTWERRGMARGLQKGRNEGAREMLLEVLASRFGSKPTARLAGRVRRIESLEELRALTRRALSGASLADLGI